MVLRICFAALLAAILVATSIPALVQSTSPAYAAAAEKEKEKTKKTKKKEKAEAKKKEKAATKEKEKAAPAAPAAAKEKAAVKDKAKKPPSEKQLAARQRMKDCGAEWQGMKKSGKAKNTTWRQFSSECLSRK